ncbi:AraC family transcriptional regulator [bacterium]|nr:MAG: AraC family transcriptional regulator [bacterium]
MIESVSRLEERRDESNRQELVSRIAGTIREDGTVEALPGLHLYRVSSPTDRIYGASRLSLCVIAQGAKTVTLGDKEYRYDAERYLLATVELPVVGRIVEASPELPYLSLRLDLDPMLVGSVMVEAGIPVPQGHGDAKAIVVSTLDSALLDAVVRLLRLIDSPTEARVIGPLLKREIVFRLLMCEQGGRLRHLPALGGHSHRIAQAIDRLQKSFDQPLRIESLAQELGMSSSGFHHHFKAVTDMSPLQFQKQLRLQEARRLMLSEEFDAASAGYRVGYDDASHFSRDYKKHFGQSPMRDVERLRTMPIAE